MIFPMKTDQQLIGELEQAIDGLLFMSESDYPFQVGYWTEVPEITPEFLCDKAGKPAESSVTTQSVDYFFRNAVSEPEWKQGRELEIAKRYQNLVRILKDSIPD